MSNSAWPDRFGVCVALACALHCASLTMIFTLYPTLWMKRKYWEIGLWQKLIWLEWGLLTLTWLILILGMTLAWQRHRHFGPGLAGLVALSFMTALITTPLHFAGAWTGYAAVGAGLLIAVAHIWNLRLSRTAITQKEAPNLLSPRPKCGPPA